MQVTISARKSPRKYRDVSLQYSTIAYFRVCAVWRNGVLQIFAKFYPKFCDSWNFVTILDSTLSIGCIHFIILTQGISKWSSCKSTGKNIWWRKNMSLARKMNARKTTAKWPSYYVFSWWNLSNITMTNVTSWSYPFDSCFLAISRLFCSFFTSIYFARQIGSYFTSSKYFAGWLTGRPFGNTQR